MLKLSKGSTRDGISCDEAFAYGNLTCVFHWALVPLCLLIHAQVPEGAGQTTRKG